VHFLKEVQFLGIPGASRVPGAYESGLDDDPDIVLDQLEAMITEEVAQFLYLYLQFGSGEVFRE
jgi:hypothetical protein